jgi:hypothetical protein
MQKQNYQFGTTKIDQKLVYNIITFVCFIFTTIRRVRRSQWPRGLRGRSAATRLLGLRIRIPPGAGRSLSWQWCVLSGMGFCVGLITHPEESYRVWCVWMWSWILDNEEALAHWGAVAPWLKKIRVRMWLMADEWIRSAVSNDSKLPRHNHS